MKTLRNKLLTALYRFVLKITLHAGYRVMWALEDRNYKIGRELVKNTRRVREIEARQLVLEAKLKGYL